MLVVAGDVTDPAVCRRLVEESVNRFGRIDAVVNNAALLEPLARVADADLEVWRGTLIVNVLGPLLLTQTALPYLRQSGGRVINVSTGAAERAVVGWSAYCTSKAALNMFNHCLALEEPEVTAVAVRPGVVDTAMQKAIRDTGQAAMAAESHDRFVQLYERDELLDPLLPGKAVAALALYAPPEWSGRFLSWDAEEVTTLVEHWGLNPTG